MTNGVPCHKGTSVIPLVEGLKRHPDGRKLVPERLWKYFDDHLVVSGWYPERDYWVLIEALVKTIDVKAVGGDVWRFFAKFSAQKDIGGIKAANSAGGTGVYRNFGLVTGSDPENFFRRASKLWSQYHDTGIMSVRAGRVSTNSVVLRLANFHIPLDGFARLQGYYLEEYGELIGLRMKAALVRSTTKGDPFCEWVLTLERTPETEAYVASLPPQTD
jgi:hypothetical protein